MSTAKEVEDRPSSDPAPELPTKPQYPAAPGKLLVADDEHLVPTGMASCLRDLGFEIIGPAADGEQALALVEQDRPDMALLDIRRPKKSGLIVAEELYFQHGIPVVIFSAFSDAEYVEACNRVGVFGYLVKPVTQDQLRVGITVAWGRFHDSMSQHSEINRLKVRLEDRKIVERAKWVIVQREGISEPEAMKHLQRQARNKRRRLADISRSLLENDDMLSW